MDRPEDEGKIEGYRSTQHSVPIISPNRKLGGVKELFEPRRETSLLANSRTTSKVGGGRTEEQSKLEPKRDKLNANHGLVVYFYDLDGFSFHQGLAT